MNDDVTIPRETAAWWATWLLHYPGYDGLFAVGARQLADLLDPKPRSLRDEVAHHLLDLRRKGDDQRTFLEDADAVLAVVADWLAVQRITPRPGGISAREQRDHDVRLLRGEQS